MGKLISYEIKHITHKKRFIILSVLLFLGLIGWAVYVKMDFLNHFTYATNMQEYLRVIFNPGVGCIVLFAQYRRRFIRTLMSEAEEQGIGYKKLVISKWCAATILFVAFYLVALVLILLLSLILGAHCNGTELWALTLSTIFGCVLAVGAYSIALFVLFLIPTFLPSWIFYLAIAAVVPIIMFNQYAFGDPRVKMFSPFFISRYTDEAYTAGVLGQARLGFLLILLIYIIISFGLSILFFYLKRKRINKKNKKLEAELIDHTGEGEIINHTGEGE